MTPTPVAIKKDINTKLFNPIGKEVIDSFCTTKTVVGYVSDESRDDELNVDASTQDTTKQILPKEPESKMVSFDKIFGAFCRRQRKQKLNNEVSVSVSRNNVQKDLCQTLSKSSTS